MSQIAEQKIALSQFSEKLSALRQTMNKQEQAMLDAVVENSAFEVSAHSIAVQSAVINQAAVNQAVNFAAVAKEADDVEDVQAHALIPTQRISLRFNPKIGYESAVVGMDDAAVSGRVA